MRKVILSLIGDASQGDGLVTRKQDCLTVIKHKIGLLKPGDLILSTGVWLEFLFPCVVGRFFLLAQNRLFS